MSRLTQERGRLSIAAFLRLAGSQLDGLAEELSGRELRVEKPNLHENVC